MLKYNSYKIFQDKIGNQYLYLIDDKVKCRARVPFVTQESLFVNENLIL
jgi:hypothetical protein